MYARKKTLLSESFYGGEGGIRTPDTLADIPPFQGGALGHYATSPRRNLRLSLVLAKCQKLRHLPMFLLSKLYSVASAPWIRVLGSLCSRTRVL